MSADTTADALPAPVSAGGATGDAILRVSGLTAGYGAAPVLQDIELTVRTGTIAAVLGANGAGKTTLLRTLSGLVRPSAGDIVFDGRPLRDVPVEQLVRRGMAHVPEGRGVVAELTVDENLRLGGLWRRDRADAARALAEVYELFEPLAQRRRHAGHQLSGGERQMLALGRALVARPKLLLLDEPSLGLAPRVIAQIMGLLRQLRDQTGLTVLLVEQNVRSALSVADEAVVMSLGRIVTATTAGRLRDDEQLRHAYLGF
ncbi:ABC transporter ATP-binding protein [Catellatospora bangladeshensis]|uniref:ABC transporter ATP-binding protein n=1 Tax=Catellatospora bangladeshensis TaxID=310355 RepID=A0A8J3JDR7_9ACTN|nr:ABC transporter ATP-binding protein [Catellatospora bangladeshensis]GIF78796.1 ABC transporter ATP-binding protein [Catellatospora bangladeshensis]